MNMDKALEQLRLRLRNFIYEELIPYEQEKNIDYELDIPEESIQWVIKRSIELGFYGINFPEEYGGQDLSLKGLCMLKEELAKSGSQLWGFVLGERGGALRIGQMAESFTEEQKQQYLLPVLKGEKGCCFALSEPEAGSDARAIQTTAVRAGDDYIINGKKHYISSAVYADFAVVITRELRDGEEDRFTAFLINKQTETTPGFELGKIQVPMSGERSTAELIFDHVRVPASSIIGEPGRGFHLGIKRINQNRATWAITYVGWAEHLLELSIQYAQERNQFGRSIANFQVIQHMLADMATEIYASKSMTYDVIEKLESGEEARAEASMAKLFAAETAFRVADRAVQIHGGQGLMKGHPVERLFRLIRMYRILTGTSEIQKNTIAKQLIRS